MVPWLSSVAPVGESIFWKKNRSMLNSKGTLDCLRCERCVSCLLEFLPVAQHRTQDLLLKGQETHPLLLSSFVHSMKTKQNKAKETNKKLFSTSNSYHSSSLPFSKCG